MLLVVPVFVWIVRVQTDSQQLTHCTLAAFQNASTCFHATNALRKKFVPMSHKRICYAQKYTGYPAGPRKVWFEGTIFDALWFSLCYIKLQVGQLSKSLVCASNYQKFEDSIF